jgi:hypothetical protein
VVLATPDLDRDRAAVASWRVVSDVEVGAGSPWSVIALEGR